MASILSFAIKGIRSMLRKMLARLVVISITMLLIVFAFNLGAAGRQAEAKRLPPIEEAEPATKGVSQPLARDPEKHVAESEKRQAVIERMIAAYDLRPHPTPTIPDNPPPHEGAMISPLPIIAEPPDLILVEVLEALPGRPISGERLIRPDGKINLGFYGDVYVRGLTLEQVKVAIIKHLRKHLNDEALGLEVQDFNDEPSTPARVKLPIPEPPKAEELFPDADGKEKAKPRKSTFRSRPGPFSVKTRAAALRNNRRSVPVRTVGFRESSQEPAEPTVPNQIKIPVNGPGQITIRIENGGQAALATEKAAQGNRFDADSEGQWHVVPPEQSHTVFVDTTAYNSKYYYVQGDALISGRLNYTGNETVLDALNFAGGLLATAEPKDIHLVRPGQSGKPPKVYTVDLEGIQQRGETATNYQLFPGDRLMVGRNEVVKKTVEIDRLVAPIHSITGNMLYEAFMLRSLQFVSSADRNELLKEYVDFWAKELARPGGVKFDEQTLRDAFIRKMNLPPHPSAPPPSSR
jgi:protein involved in polysaccharide export with SLBB domain